MTKKGRNQNMNSGVSLYSDVMIEEVNWLWYPYIPFGKITLIQGDPGCGKSSLVMNIIADATRGREPYKNRLSRTPLKAIYQCSEDGLADTIKPRLLMSGADCRNVGFINEETSNSLTLDDERLGNAIREFGAKVLVIDPIQAYAEKNADLQMATRARKLMRKLSDWANEYDCAVILIGHLTKKESGKDIYRGLGSVDIVAAARSVLHVHDEDGIRTVKQVKNSLAQIGDDSKFYIDPEFGFRWIKDEVDFEAAYSNQKREHSKSKAAMSVITSALKDGDKSANEMNALLKNIDCGIRTIKNVKKAMGVQSYRKGNKWYWTINN